MESHDQESHDAPNFDHHDLSNAVVSFMMPLLAHNAYASGSCT